MLRADSDIGFTVAAHSNLAEIICTLLAIINGAAHALAWNSHFPSEVEQQIYRTACISSVACPVLLLAVVYDNGFEWFLLNFVYSRRSRSMFEEWKFWRAFELCVNSAKMVVRDRAHHKGLMKAGWLGDTGRWLLLVIAIMCSVLYFAIMTVITIEPWLSVRELEKGSYDTVEWAEMLPHL